MKTFLHILAVIVAVSLPVLAEETNTAKNVAAVLTPFDLSGLPETPQTEEERRLVSIVRNARNSAYSAHVTLARYYKAKGDSKRTAIEQKRADYWAAVKIPGATTESQVAAGTSSLLAGVWRVRAANVGGAGGAPSLSPIVIQADGTYTFSSSHGTYSVAGDTITFSDMKLHPAGRLSGNTIIFEYEYNGLHQTLTFYRASDAPGAAAPSSAPGNRGEIALNLTVQFPPNQDGYIGWVNTLKLAPAGAGGSSFDQTCVRGS
jgi:hypothetical protein